MSKPLQAWRNFTHTFLVLGIIFLFIGIFSDSNTKLSLFFAAGLLHLGIASFSYGILAIRRFRRHENTAFWQILVTILLLFCGKFLLFFAVMGLVAIWQQP